jgi:hypothetical protein
MTSQAHKHSTTDAMSTTNELIISISNPGSKCGEMKAKCVKKISSGERTKE